MQLHKTTSDPAFTALAKRRAGFFAKHIDEPSYRAGYVDREADPKATEPGTYTTTWTDAETGIAFTIHYSFTAGEAATPECAGEAPELHLQRAFHCGADFTTYLTDAQVDAIEAAIWAELETAQSGRRRFA